MAGFQHALRQHLESVGDSIVVNGRRTPAAPVRAFYEQRDHVPLWVGQAGLNNRAKDAIAVFENAASEGLDPVDYTVSALTSPNATATANEEADREVLLSATLVRYVTDLKSGRSLPNSVDPQWAASRKTVDASVALESAAATPDLSAYLVELAPDHVVYRGLRDALHTYRALEASGGWPDVPDGPKLEPGVTDPRIGALRARLRKSGELDDAAPSRPDHFDPALEAAVKVFQDRHGLDTDGVVGKRTLEALRVSASERVRQIVVNMERWRRMPDNLGDPHVLVNMAGFELRLVEDGAVALNMRVVVGKPYRQTPDISSRVSYLVFNPYWNVPHSIAVKDILPKVQDDPFYLVDRGIHVYDGWQDGTEVDPWMVDWWSLTKSSFPYRLRQDPGPKNALGRIKFMFPNEHAVYMHDTPSRSLFRRSVRTFSSGCIRLEKPFELAERLLKNNPGWNSKRIKTVIESGETRSVSLKTKVPLHLIYLTAWAGEDGAIQFRRDIYGRDRKLANALFGESH
ncbi:MAG: L,D-transpeptidase family protein [Rhodospirillales bacterium]|nr:L,D-transpeptidase family protein [Rhodospirillales bacterium]